MIWSKEISNTGLFQNIMSDKDPKFTSDNLFGTQLSFSTANHPRTDGPEEIMIQTLEDIIGIFSSHGLELKDSYGFNHYWCTLIPAHEIAYKISIK
ncbi:hypothetical protein O181_125273 [Austropuccinia psidii MF-1]|uniref:Integrase catalytic domain-containing protein n=1 Tax=Austropuccinia psidii MF-1 TaxID=1389203 RepID=A0A9Q3Q4W2_9BASI|nr:hypothetical protein [Austropuccinia psidii MF-1]